MAERTQGNERDPARDRYQQRVGSFGEQQKCHLRLSSRLANLRLAAFLVFLLPLVLGFWLAGDEPLGIALAYGLSAAGLITFLLLAARHARVDDEAGRFGTLVRLNEEALARLERNWSLLPEPLLDDPIKNEPVAVDLDLFGQASVYHLLSLAVSPDGRRRVAEELLHGCPPGLREQRHEAVRELADRVDLRQEVAAAGAGLAGLPERPPLSPIPGQDRLPQWLVRVLPKASPVALLLLLASALAGWVPHALWVGLVVFHILLTSIFKKRIAARLAPIAGRERELRGYARMFDALGTAQHRCDHLAGIARISASAATGTAALDDLATRTAARGSLPYPLLRSGGLWDFQTIARLDAWEARHADEVGAWFEALAEFELLSSLAQLLSDEPGWSFATHGSPGRISARQIAHPLLPAPDRVTNDLELGPSGTFLLLTGSNMSGKSTLLRSLGVNLCLARMGAPVCAASLAFPDRTLLATSLRVEDSLTAGTSFFRAELDRIKAIVDLALKHQEDGSSVVFLLDEILRGTNSEERRAIVSRVVAHLCDLGTTGVVTTHDLALAEIPALRDRRQLAHFREHFHEVDGEMEMTFDYTLREGLAPTTNALAMMRMVGLDLEKNSP